MNVNGMIMNCGLFLVKKNQTKSAVFVKSCFFYPETKEEIKKKSEKNRSVQKITFSVK